MKRFLCAFLFFIAFCVHAEEDLVPDPHLRRVISETLELSKGTAIRQHHLESLTDIGGLETGIEDLTGLEHATALIGLGFQNRFRACDPRS